MSYQTSCIDLIVTSQTKIVMKSKFHTSLHENYHQKLVYTEFNLKKLYAYQKILQKMSRVKFH